MSGLLAFTLFHVALSIAAIAAGFVVVYGLLNGRAMGRWTLAFLAMTAATTVTGFLFPLHGFTPAIGTGIVSSIVLLLAVAARYRFRLAGPWRPVYVVGALVSLYLNCFVFVVQAFQKVPALKALAPSGNEPVFAATQGVVLLGFVILGFLAVKAFRVGMAAAAN